jgi:hypothetical protein
MSPFELIDLPVMSPALPVMSPFVLIDLPVMSPFLPVMSPPLASAAEHMAKVKSEAQRIDLKLFI